MQQTFIHKQNSSKLILFFSGWGMDKAHFADLSHPTADIALCYDYSSENFDVSVYRPYAEIIVVGWSMGVFMANHTLKKHGVQTVSNIAVNGTLYPIDLKRGIPPAIYDGTLEKLNESTIIRFNRRMCGTKAAFERFSQNSPQRNIESLKQELEAIKHTYGNRDVKDYGTQQWDKVIIGKNDLIFPFQNQLEAWRGAPEITVTEDAHYIGFGNLIKHI